MANSVYQYEQPRCPDKWNESERRFYNRLIQVLDDIYSKYGRIDEKMLSKKVITKIDNSAITTLENIAANIITAQKIVADTIEATYAHVMSLTAKYGSFDFATVKNLISDALVVEKGQGDYVHITNFAATYAQMVNATIANLCIKSSDGGYYELDVNEQGQVTTRLVAVSDEELLAGATMSGKPIVGTNISAETLDADTIAASLGLYNQITANLINVDSLVAREAFINALTSSKAFIDNLFVSDSAFIETLVTSKILGGNSLEIVAGKVEEAARVFRMEEFPGPTVVVEADDLLVKPSTGQQYQAVKTGDISFALDADGNLYYSYDGSGSLSMQGFDLYADGFALPVDESGEVGGAPYEWVLVEDLMLREAIAAQAAEMAEAVLALNRDIANIQDQIDGNITTWFEAYVPTNSNYPANEWITDDLKNQHLGDLFYVENDALEENGYCYRWQQTNGVYGWVLLEDSGVAKALAAAAAAQDTADSKRRVFFATPVPPYDAGDLWVQGSGGDIMRCATAKASGQSYAASDWVKASKYTDDTIANEALNKAIYDSATPPETAPAAGKLWLDRSVVPPVLRRWLGLSLLPDDLDGWETVNDTATIEAAQAALDAQQKQSETAIKELQTVVRIDTQGVHVGKAGNDNSEVLIENDRIRIVVRGKAYAAYAGDYMILGGDMELRRPASGGLAIGPV